MFVVVHTVRHLVEGGAGHRADLACVVHAEPTAEVVWYKNSMRLDLNRGYISRQEGRKHHLTIPSVGEEDFANYTCEATNSLGKSRAAIQLRGNPRPPVYNSKVSQCWSEAGEDSRSVLQVEFVSSHCYRVSWATLSYQEILQYRVQWRKAGVSRDTSSLPVLSQLTFQTYSAILTPNWISHVFTGPMVGGEQPIGASWDIQGLQERQGYEARVQAKNR